MTAYPYPTFTYDQIVIGAGSSAAMYLNTLCHTYRRFSTVSDPLPLAILVIGMEDPWAGARGYDKGHYTEKINQAKQLFDHGTGPKASMDDTPVDRRDWAGKNQAIIDKVTQNNVLIAEVTSVTRDPVEGAEDFFLVTTASNGTYRAKKVIIATGAGIETSDREYHVVPREVAAFGANPAVMDLDQFQTGTGGSKNGGGKKLGVIGENAGTDAIMEAATRGYPIADVYWFMPRGTTPGTKLTWDTSGLSPTFTADQAGKDKGAQGGCVVRYNSTFRLSTQGRQILVTCDGATGYAVDYFVYAKGQFGGGINRAQRDANKVTQVPFVSSTLAANLEPIYDVNQRLSTEGAWEHIVGIQLKGSTATHGVTVVGSAAFQAGRKVEHNYLDDEYQQMLTRLGSITALFRNLAVDHFVELIQFKKFSLILTNGSLKKKTAKSFDTKKKKFVESVAYKIETSGLALSLPAKDRTAHVRIGRALAQELCYLFLLRFKAAQYYNGLTGGRAPSRPDQLQSAGLKRTLPVTVADGRLLGGMQRNITAINQSYNEPHIKTQRGNNYLEDQQSLALYIAVHYPNIPPARANELVQQIIQERQGKLRGFTPEDMGRWDFKLEAADREVRCTLGFAYKTYYRA